jgi:hypothetical protein
MAIKTYCLVGAGLATSFGFWAAPAAAHHSFAMFDNSKTVTYSGVVKEVQWANPHVWVELVVTDNGKTDTYHFEGGAVPVLKRVGWTRDSVKSGDKLTVATHPFRDGRPGGSLERVTLPNGKIVAAGDAVPGALQVPDIR